MFPPIPPRRTPEEILAASGSATIKVEKPLFTEVQQQNRTYKYPNGGIVALEGVKSINVSKSGTHRLNTVDGKKHIVPPGWIHIEFDAADWTF